MSCSWTIGIGDVQRTGSSAGNCAHLNQVELIRKVISAPIEGHILSVVLMRSLAAKLLLPLDSRGTGCYAGGLVCSLVALVTWQRHTAQLGRNLPF